MPKLICPCGYRHNLNPIPDKGWVTVRDEEWDDLWDKEIKYKQLKTENPRNDGEIRKLIQGLPRKGMLYECPDCGRLMWLRTWLPDDQQLMIFAPEKPALEHDRTTE